MNVQNYNVLDPLAHFDEHKDYCRSAVLQSCQSLHIRHNLSHPRRLYYAITPMMKSLHPENVNKIIKRSFSCTGMHVSKGRESVWQQSAYSFCCATARTVVAFGSFSCTWYLASCWDVSGQNAAAVLQFLHSGHAEKEGWQKQGPWPPVERFRNSNNRLSERNIGQVSMYCEIFTRDTCV